MRNFSLVTPDAIDFVPSTLADFSTLLTLEIGYQQEEVMVAKHHLLSENAIATHFRRRLTQEEGYHLQYKEHILSKASINVAGRAYDQVAGVYTTPRLRGKGLAKILFYHLFQLYIVRNKALVLFVKQENRSALRLYQSVGFREKQTYRISYL
nr:GNAT family N-acetyltransferase [Entomospira culicis]